MSRRVVVTGVGLVCGCGIGTDEVWRNLWPGRAASARSPISTPPRSIAASPAKCTTSIRCTGSKKKNSRKWRGSSSWPWPPPILPCAWPDLKITPEIADATGVYIGSGIGGFDVIEREHSKYLQGGPGKISPFFIPAAIINLASGHVSIRYGAKGPNSATATACSASAHAVGDAFNMIQRGDAEVMIAAARKRRSRRWASADSRR